MPTDRNRQMKIGCSSFVLPDHLRPNVEWLAPRVDDVQVLLLEPESDLPSADDLQRLRELALQHGLSYSLHAPSLVATDGAAGEQAAEKVAHMLRLVEPLDVGSAVAHIVPAPPREAEALQRWIDRAAAVIERCCELASFDPTRLLIENQWAYDVACNAQLSHRAGCRLCLDLGHILLAGEDPLPITRRHLSQTRQLHIHGVDDRDHRSLQHFAPLKGLLDLLAELHYNGLITVEVFNEADLDSSWQALRQHWPAELGDPP